MLSPFAYVRRTHMDSEHTTKRLFRAVLSCLFALAVCVPCVPQQPGDDPLQLQRIGLAKIASWQEHVRSTGEAASVRELLVEARAAFEVSVAVFIQRSDFSNAAWGTINLGNTLRYMNQSPQAIAVFQDAVSLSGQAHRTDLQVKALASLAFSEMGAGSMDAAGDHVREAVRLGENCGNKDFYFDSLNVAGQVETKQGDLAAANDYLNRALALGDQIGDKYQLYSGYANRADVYYQDAKACDYKQGYDVCYQFLQLSQDDYKKAKDIAQARGYSFLAEMAGTFLQQDDDRRALIQLAQKNNQELAAMPMFNPKQPKDVLATEYFTTPAADAQNLATLESAVKETKDWQMRFQKQGLIVLDMDADDFSAQGSLAQWKGDLNTALAKFLQAIQLVEQDRRKLRDEKARSAFMEDRLNDYYSAAWILLQQKRYAEAFALFEESRSRAMADLLASAPLGLGNPHERELFSEMQS